MGWDANSPSEPRPWQLYIKQIQVDPFCSTAFAVRLLGTLEVSLWRVVAGGVRRVGNRGRRALGGVLDQRQICNAICEGLRLWENNSSTGSLFSMLTIGLFSGDGKTLTAPVRGGTIGQRSLTYGRETQTPSDLPIRRPRVASDVAVETIRWKKRLGGLLESYSRKAA